MKKTTILTLILTALLLFPNSLFADAVKADWFGNWTMNHDGHAGILTVSDTRVDCATSMWCDMRVIYTDKNGTRFTGAIQRIDSNGQHMIFFINFPGNRQRFDAYIFSWDKSKLAGTTIWSGKTFGFYATKR